MYFVPLYSKYPKYIHLITTSKMCVPHLIKDENIFSIYND